jgi:TM2 domain-containing membrane protein YozV
VVEPKPPPVLQRQRRSNPTLAGWLSFFPGLGQLYNRQPGKGIAFLLGVLALFFAALNVPALTDLLLFIWQPRGSTMVLLSLLVQMISLLLFVALLLAGFTFWYAAMHDARASAQEINGERPRTGRWWFFRRLTGGKSQT